MGGFWNIILHWITLPCISTNTTKVRNIYVCNYLQRVTILRILPLKRIIG